MNQKRLAAVLRIRTLQERGARGELARTRRDHHRARAVEEHTWLLLDELAPPVTRGTSVQDLESRRNRVEAGVLSAHSLHTETVRAHDSMQTAKQEWTVAARRVEALERLAERIGEAERLESARLAGNEIDDLVLARRGREGGTDTPPAGVVA